MWATSWHGDNQGGGYGVGTMNGNYAESREDALYYAACELESIVKNIEGVAASLILKWAVSLKENPEAAE